MVQFMPLGLLIKTGIYYYKNLIPFQSRTAKLFYFKIRPTCFQVHGAFAYQKILIGNIIPASLLTT